jgi:hypothetical protein
VTAAAAAGASVRCAREWVGRLREEGVVYPDLRVIRKGRLVAIPLRELERWTVENAETTL